MKSSSVDKRVRPITKEELAILPVTDKGVPIIMTNSRFKEFLPPLEDSERNNLKTSILSFGCHTPVVVWKQSSTAYILVDGHNRYEICTQYGSPFMINVANFKDEKEVMDWIFSQQFARRNVIPTLKQYLTGQRAIELMTGKGLKEDKEDDRPRVARLIETIAILLSVSLDYVRGAIKFTRLANRIGRLAGDGMKKVFIYGELDLSKSHLMEMMRFTDMEIMEFFRVVLPEGEGKPKNSIASGVSAIRHGRRKEKIITTLTAAPRKRFAIIVADPPWQYDYSQSLKAEIEQQYSTMETWEICKMGVQRIAGHDSTLFLWVPPALLESGLKVMSAWGFKYVTSLVWKKRKSQRGKYARMKHELVLIGDRGSPYPFHQEQLESVFEGDPEEMRHSSKPATLQDYIDRVASGLPKAEIFARRGRIGWWCFGNEITNPDLIDVNDENVNVCNESEGELYELEQ